MHKNDESEKFIIGNIKFNIDKELNSEESIRKNNSNKILDFDKFSKEVSKNINNKLSIYLCKKIEINQFYSKCKRFDDEIKNMIFKNRYISETIQTNSKYGAGMFTISITPEYIIDFYFNKRCNSDYDLKLNFNKISSDESELLKLIYNVDMILTICDSSDSRKPIIENIECIYKDLKNFNLNNLKLNENDITTYHEFIYMINKCAFNITSSSSPKKLIKGAK